MVLLPLTVVLWKLGSQRGVGVGVWDKDGTTMPHAASLCGCLQHGANEDAVDAENRSPLHWAGVCWGQGVGLGGSRTAGTMGRRHGCGMTFGEQDRLNGWRECWVIV